MKNSKLYLRKYPDPILETPCEAITSFDDDLKNLVKDMFDVMVKHDGVGLSAPQVGINKKVFIACEGEEEKEKPELSDIKVFVNPEFLEGNGEVHGTEGCLSLPGVMGMVKRHATVKLRYQDLDGNWHEEDFEKRMAVVVQHEYDHMHGIMFHTKLEFQETSIRKEVESHLAKLRKAWKEKQQSIKKQIQEKRNRKIKEH